jgi:NAD(P)-dependent dehydrogenase (short-subunit alcohol dehydrogenase family)
MVKEIMDEYPLALVTGGAQRLGRSFALALARQKYAVFLHYYRSAKAAESTAAELRAMDVPVYMGEADLLDSAQIKSLFDVIDSLNLRLKVLVNSAATMSRADLKTISSDDWDLTLNLNLRAPFLLTQLAAVRMPEGGLVVNVTDAGAGKPWTGFPAYVISKSGLDTLTRLQAKTYAPQIRVNAIAPGLVLPDSDISLEQWDKLVNRLPLGHPASLDEITMALDFLLRNESITGQTIVVDGGYSLL